MRDDGNERFKSRGLQRLMPNDMCVTKTLGF